MDATEATDLKRRLEAAGRSLLGFGDAGIVLGIDTRTVMKIVFDPGDGWPAWARWCMEHHGPHLPVIYRLDEIQHAGEPLAFVGVLERLVPTIVMARWIKPDRSLKRDPLRLASLIEAEHPTVSTMLREVATCFPGARWDATPSNWMERIDGTVVLTDPFMKVDDPVEIRAAA